MRRWELVTGGSAKFWEVGREGSSATVRFGRLGTAGQTQTKELASAEAAEAHVAKLVAEKEKKGYRPVGSLQPPARRPEPPAAEDTWVMPRAWLRDVVRHRGFDPAPEFTLDHAKAAGDADHIETRAGCEGCGGHQPQPTITRHGGLRLGNDVRRRAGQPGEHLQRTGEIELGQLRKDDEADIELGHCGLLKSEVRKQKSEIRKDLASRFRLPISDF